MIYLYLALVGVFVGREASHYYHRTVHGVFLRGQFSCFHWQYVNSTEEFELLEQLVCSM